VPKSPAGPVLSFDETSSCKVVPMAGATTTVIAFSGLQELVGMPLFEFGAAVSGLGANCIFVRDPHRSWYQTPSDLGATALEKARAIRAVAEGIGSQRLVCVGTSMGGFAAMLFGALMQADQALSFGGQAFISAKGRRAWGDNRWDNTIDRINATMPDAVLDVRPAIRKSKVRVSCFAGSQDRLDIVHSLFISAEPNVRAYCAPGGPHNVAGFLKKKGVLDELLRAALGPAGGDADAFDAACTRHLLRLGETPPEERDDRKG
jgi:hypothetical protein